MAMNARVRTGNPPNGPSGPYTLLPVRRGIGLLRSALFVAAVCLTLSATAAAQESPRPFSISVDGVPVAGADDNTRRGSASSEEVDVKVKFDGLDSKPILNISTVPPRRSFAAGETVDFLASSNYPDWIERMELRILKPDTGVAAAPLDVVAVNRDGKASWTMPADGPDEVLYVLRVYDSDGAFDETVPLTLLRSEASLPFHGAVDAPAAGTGEDRTAIRNIDVYGGSVTVYGRSVPAGHQVTVFGETVPVDGDGSFVTQRILPPGDHAVAVEVEDGGGKGLSFERDVYIPTMTGSTSAWRTSLQASAAVRITSRM